MKFKTENLYLVKICKIVKVETNDDEIVKHYKNSGRNALAYKKSDMTFEDIFTHTCYKTLRYTEYSGISSVIESEPIITNTKYLTEEEALRILKELNPTYLKEEKTKRLRLFKQ